MPGEFRVPFILGIKQNVANQGVYRYADMFAFAEHLLAKMSTS